MRYENLEPLRRKLLDRKLSLVKRREHALADAQGLREEREPDWEDAAALATTAGLLETLGETERRELGRLDEALTRMERGAYGQCVVCHDPIEAARLESVPETDRCGACAGA
jgi:DnaK suppressor protein